MELSAYIFPDGRGTVVDYPVPPLWEVMFGDFDVKYFSEVEYAGVLKGSKFRENGRWPRAPLKSMPSGVLHPACTMRLYVVPFALYIRSMLFFPSL